MLSWHGLDEFVSSDTEWSNPQQKFLHKNTFFQFQTDTYLFSSICILSDGSPHFTRYRSTTDQISWVYTTVFSSTLCSTSVWNMHIITQSGNMLRLTRYEGTFSTSKRFFELLILMLLQSRDGILFSFVMIPTIHLTFIFSLCSF